MCLKNASQIPWTGTLNAVVRAGLGRPNARWVPNLMNQLIWFSCPFTSINYLQQAVNKQPKFCRILSLWLFCFHDAQTTSIWALLPRSTALARCLDSKFPAISLTTTAGGPPNVSMSHLRWWINGTANVFLGFLCDMFGKGWWWVDGCRHGLSPTHGFPTHCCHWW